MTMDFPTAVNGFLPQDRPATPAAGSSKERSGHASKDGDRYQDIEKLGNGSYGVVVRAIDSRLQREVAVKRLKPSAGQREQVVHRFVNEALITGQLEHPGIVPVYDRNLGPENGQHFYAMKILNGPTFAKKIKSYHAMAKGPEKRKAFHELLRCFVGIAEAVGFAHSKGIVHRDLKPSNIVVGEFGEAIVVDWGLAKRLNETELHAGSDSTSQANDSTDFGGNETRIGTVAGTPNYMSPEQASGRIDQIDATTDVFALAVILYRILTGELPFRGEDTHQTLKNVRKCEFRKPRDFSRLIPRSLDAICCTGLSANKEQRYATADELAADVKHFLAGEKVSAHQETLSDRLQRFGKRQTQLVMNVIAFLVLATVLSVSAGVAIKSAHNAEVKAHEETLMARLQEAAATVAEQKAKRKVVERLESTRQAGDDWLFGLNHSLQQVPAFDAIRHDLLNRAIGHYQDIYDSLANHPEEQIEAGICQVRIGNLLLLLKKYNTANHAFQEASSLLLPFVDEREPLPSQIAQRERVHALVGSACVEMLLGKPSSERVDLLRSSVDKLKLLNNGHLFEADYLDSLGRAQLVLGIELCLTGADAEAARVLEDAIEDLRKVTPQDRNAQQVELFDSVKRNLASLAAYRRETDHAIKTLLESIQHSTILITRSPRHDWIGSRGRVRACLGDLYCVKNDLRKADQAYALAIQDLSHSTTVLQGKNRITEQLALAHAKRGIIRVQLGKTRDAERILRLSIDQLNDLSAARHSSPVDLSLQWPYSGLEWMVVDRELNPHPGLARSINLAQSLEVAKRLLEQLEDGSASDRGITGK